MCLARRREAVFSPAHSNLTQCVTAIAPQRRRAKINGGFPAEKERVSRRKPVTAMKSNAPWSVKGIERDARETAKEAAKREGMTVGEWLNQMIYSAGDPESSGGNVEGLKLRDVVTAIDHLHKRIADSATETGGAVTDVSRKMGDVVERVQRLERTKPAGGERDRIDALKALEKAVAQVAVQFSNAQKTTLERIDASETSLQKLTRQIESLGGGAGDDASGVAFLKDAVDGLQSRIARTEKLVSEAASGDGDASTDNEQTRNRLRVLGDEIKRGGDQIRTLESTIEKLSQQIEGAERRSAEGVHKTAETLSELREKFFGEQFDAVNKDDIAEIVADQTRDTIDRVDRLQALFETMITRLDAATGAEPSMLDKSAANAVPTSHEEDETAIAASAHGETTAESEEAPGDDHSELADDLTALELIDDAEPTAPESDSAAETVSETSAEAHDDNDDDDDFFSFAEEIDASIDDTATSEREDGFSFELDGDEAQNNADDSEDVNPEGAAVLSEVQGVFSGDGAELQDDDTQDEAPDAFAPEPFAPGDFATDENTDEQTLSGDVGAEKESVDSELDELLAGLDDISEAPPPAPASTEPSDPDELEAPADGVGEELSKEDLLKSIRRKAREDAAARAASEDNPRPTRRKLTPKQKAILAARARRKKQAEQGGAKTEDPETVEATKKALEAGSHAITVDDDGVDDVDGNERDAGKFAAFRGKFPFFGGAKKDDEDEESDDPQPSDSALHDVDGQDVDGDREAIETLKSTASARPITLALGVGIFLAVGLLFFAVKDFIFSPPAGEGPITQSAEPPAAAIAEPTLEAPTPPAIEPKTLYRDAMTGLNAAGNEAETSVAIEKLEQAALLGHPPAQLQLGELYKTGQGVDQDIAQARTWFRRAANGGNILAMHRIGVMTARGEGGTANTPEAIGWFEQAANRGLVDSQYNLGAIYHPSGDGENLQGDLQDAGKAYYWYALASLNGDDQATPLAAGVGATLGDSQRAELDEAIGAWAAVPADVEANTLETTG